MNVNIKIATAWNDLSKDQLKRIASSIHLSEEIEDEKIKSELLYQWFWKELIRPNTVKASYYALKEIPIADVIPHVQFLFDGIHRTLFFPTIKTGFFKSYAPGPRLNNISIAEFSLADAAFYMWRKKQDKEYLNLLCAILYRPKKWIGTTDTDKRTTFNKFKAEKRSKLFENIELSTKLAIALTFEGCRNHIVDCRPNLFPKTEDATPINYEGFKKIILSKSGGKFGSFSETNDSLAVDFLDEIEEEIIQSKKQ